MKLSITLLGMIIGGVLATTAAEAQQASQPMPAAQQTTPATGSATAGTDTTSTRFKTADGTSVQINSHPGQVPPAGPAPDFATLDANHNGSISRSEAVAYRLLADDFNYADGNHNGAISKSEYTRWVNLP